MSESTELVPGLAPEYAAAVAEMAKFYGMTEMQVLRAAIRLYQAQRFGSITIVHLDRGPLMHPLASHKDIPITDPLAIEAAFEADQAAEGRPTTPGCL